MFNLKTCQNIDVAAFETPLTIFCFGLEALVDKSLGVIFKRSSSHLKGGMHAKTQHLMNNQETFSDVFICDSNRERERRRLDTIFLM